MREQEFEAWCVRWIEDMKEDSPKKEEHWLDPLIGANLPDSQFVQKAEPNAANAPKGQDEQLVP